jgi:hypothetical protein
MHRGRAVVERVLVERRLQFIKEIRDIAARYRELRAIVSRSPRLLGARPLLV